jgi:hypothetical protein
MVRVDAATIATMTHASILGSRGTEASARHFGTYGGRLSAFTEPNSSRLESYRAAILYDL